MKSMLQIQCPTCEGVFEEDSQDFLLNITVEMECLHCGVKEFTRKFRIVGILQRTDPGDYPTSLLHRAESILGEEKEVNTVTSSGRVKGYNLYGVGPDAEIISFPTGGKQSKSPYRFDLLPPLAVARIAAVLAKGAEKYTPWNWLLIDVDQHLNRVLQHSFAYIAGDEQEVDEVEHLAHAACRALMALEIALRDQQDEEAERLSI